MSYRLGRGHGTYLHFGGIVDASRRSIECACEMSSKVISASKDGDEMGRTFFSSCLVMEIKVSLSIFSLQQIQPRQYERWFGPIVIIVRIRSTHSESSLAQTPNHSMRPAASFPFSCLRLMLPCM